MEINVDRPKYYEWNIDSTAKNLIYDFGSQGTVLVSANNANHLAGTHTYLYEYNFL